MKILLHVNYCEGRGRLPELLAMAVRLGYDGVELRWKYAFDDLTQEEYQQRVADFKSRHPAMEIVFGGGIKFCRGEADEVRRDTDRYLDFLPWARAQCGTTIMNGTTGPMVALGCTWRDYDRNGSAMATEKDYQDAAAGLRVIGRRAGELGMKIGLETHCCYLHDTAASSRKLMDLTDCPHVGLNYDQGNIFAHPHGESIDEVFRLIGGKMVYAHLKNAHKVKGEYLAAPLRYGAINTRYILQKLNLPMLATEYPCTGDGFYAAKDDLDYMRFTLQNLSLT